MEKEQGIRVSEEHVCRYFDRIQESLIEEPEVCEWCSFYRDGYCIHEAQR